MPRIHIFQDMDAQAKVKPQQIGPKRADGRSILPTLRGQPQPAEDRFLFLNMPKLAQRFVDEFELLWSRANPPS